MTAEDGTRGAGAEREPKRRPAPAVGAVVVRDRAILLIRRGRPPSRGLWSLPGGRVEWGETMAQALRREVAEETGLEIEVGAIAGIVERIDPMEGFHYVIVDYFATATSGTLRAGGDATGARWVLPEEMDRLPLVPGLLEALANFGIPD